jgi:hypothetical protein
LSGPVHSSGALPYVPCCLFRLRFSRMILLGTASYWSDQDIIRRIVHVLSIRLEI